MSALSSIDKIVDGDKKLCAPELKDISQFLTDQMVDIFVGTEKKKFHLHRDLLCERSDYFRASFAGNFKEAQENEHFLPEDDFESFGMLVGYLYGAPLKRMSSNDDMPRYLSLIVLANKLCLEYLRNETMDCILRFHRTNTVINDFQNLRYIFQNTTIPDKTCIYIFSLAVVNVPRFAELTYDEQNLIREGGDCAVYYTAILAYIRALGNAHGCKACDPRRASNCQWHKHNSTPICSKPAK